MTIKPAVATFDRPSTTSSADPISTRWALASLAPGVLLPALGTSIANVALPSLSHAFDASMQSVQWVVIAYLLAVTTLVVGAGRLGDVVGRKRLLLGGIALFTLASIGCAVAPTLEWLIVGRVAQGIGAAAMMALTMALASERFPKSGSGNAIGMLGSMSAIGTALGPSLGGILIAACGWHAIFWINVPAGIVALILVRRHLPADALEDKSMSVAQLDPRGTLLLASTLAAYALAVTLGRGNFGALNLALLLAAVAGAVAFVRVESRADAPLIRLSMLRDRTLGSGFAASALIATVMMATLIVGPFHLSRALGLDVAVVGIVVSIGPIVAALTAAPAGRAVDRYGAQRMSIAGLVAVAAGCLVLSVMPSSAGIAGYAGPIVIVTAGYALFQTANNTMVMTAVRTDEKGVVSGVLNLSRNLGLITGASVMGAVLAMAAGGPDSAAAQPQDVANATRFTFGVAAALAVTALVALVTQVNTARVRT